MYYRIVPLHAEKQFLCGHSLVVMLGAPSGILRVQTTFVTPKPPPAVAQASEAAAFVSRLSHRTKRRKEQPKEAPVLKEKATARLPIIVGTGEFPTYESAEDEVDDLRRELTAYDELQRVVMRVNRVFDAYAHAQKEDSHAPPLGDAEVELLHSGITDMLSLQERVALERKVLLRDALAKGREGRESEEGVSAMDEVGTGAEALVNSAIAAKQSQKGRLATLHEGEMALLIKLQATISELAEALKTSRAEGQRALGEVADLRINSEHLADRLATSERNLEEARVAVRATRDPSLTAGSEARSD